MHSDTWNTATTTMNTAAYRASGRAAVQNCWGYAAASPLTLYAGQGNALHL
jgi:hypothetical protein